MELKILLWTALALLLVARADDGPMNPASFSFAINQNFLQNFIKATIRASQNFQNSEFIELIPDFLNIQTMLFEPEQVQMMYNITNIYPKLFQADTERFFMRNEEKYGLQELNIENINIEYSFDYEVMMIPPIFVDKGTIRFSCEDLSLNTVWRFELNEKRTFFDVLISHILVQVNPKKFKVMMDSYSDLTILINKQLNLIIEYALNDLLAILRYKFAELAQTSINQPIDEVDIIFAIDPYMPYKAFGLEPANLHIKINSESQPVLKETYISLFLNATMFQALPEEAQEVASNLISPDMSTILPSYIDNGEQLQVYIQDNFINHIFEVVYNAGLLDVTIKSINTLDLQLDYYASIFLINDIDTNLISVFVPEIYADGSNFLDRDRRGIIKPYPCKLRISEYKKAPKISFQGEFADLQSYIKLGISCMNKHNETEKVIEIETSSFAAFKIELASDLVIKIRLRQFNLQYERLTYSSLG